MDKPGEVPARNIPAALAYLLAGVTRLVVLTGAGISVESGIPPFRGPQGLWRNFRPEEIATPQAFQRDPGPGVGMVQLAPGKNRPRPAPTRGMRPWSASRPASRIFC